jgi:hypothetical protein
MHYCKVLLIYLLFFVPVGQYSLFSLSAVANFSVEEIASSAIAEQTTMCCTDQHIQQLAYPNAERSSVFTLSIPRNSEQKKPDTACLTKINTDFSGIPSLKKKPFKATPAFSAYHLATPSLIYFRSSANLHPYQIIDMVTLLHAYRC